HGAGTAGRPGGQDHRRGRYRQHARGQWPGAAGTDRGHQLAADRQQGVDEDEARPDTKPDPIAGRRRRAPRQLICTLPTAEEYAMNTPLKITRLDANQADFTHHLDGLLAWEGVSDKAVNERVEEIIAAVRQRGDAALVEY